MVGIHENQVSWTYWDEYIQYLIDKNKTVQKIREKLKKERSYKLKRIHERN
ncbi:MAG: hypothetical protein HWN81_16375 [Candidatus Lokiarchaeota archaeon]|nr:hypothetical protein [Candidatus Lokiarchaeota archaeon]